MMRTTCAMTKMEGGKAYNVIPPMASVGMNLRLIGRDTVESARDYLSRTIQNPDIEVRVVEGRNPSAESDTSCREWELFIPGSMRHLDRGTGFPVSHDGMQRFLALLQDHGQGVQILCDEAV